MPSLRHMCSSVWAVFNRKRFEAEMRAELQFHVEMQSLEHQRRGMSRDEADRAARRDLGGIEQVKERCREVRGVLWLQDLWRDLQYGWRNLARSPGFTLVAVLTLGLGIGANTAVFSVINSVVLEPLPFADPGRLVMLWSSNPEIGIDAEQVSFPDFLDWRTENRVFDSIGLVVNQMAMSRNFLLRLGDSPIRIRGRYASSGLFETLGVRPILGRAFGPEDEVEGAEKKAILSYGLWQRAFSADPKVIGRAIDVGDSYRVIGVMPRSFAFPPDAELWLSWTGFPFRVDKERRDRHSAWAVARLRPGVSAEQAEAELTGLQQRIAKENPHVQKIATHVKVVPLLDQVIGSGTKSTLLLLFGAVGFVALIACANLANLLLARATARRKEIVFRAALGASRGRIVRQLLTESLLLALVAGSMGIVLALGGIQVLEAIRPDDTFRSVKEFRFDRVQDVALDARVLGFTLVASLLTGLLFGLVPALQASKFDLNEALKEGGRSTTAGRGIRRLGSALLVCEVALSLVLLAGAVQMLQSFIHMRQADIGLRPEQVLTVGIDLDMARHKYAGSDQDVYDQIHEKLESLPGVLSIAGAGENPLVTSGWTDSVAIAGRPVTAHGELQTSEVRVATPELFHTLAIPILRGRDFNEHDTAAAPKVAIVSQEFARRFFGDQSPVGASFRFRAIGPPIEIVGVVGDVRSLGPKKELRPEVYLPYQQSIFMGGDLGPILVVRTAGDPRQLLEAMRRRVEGSHSGGAMLVNFRTADQVLGASVSSERFQTMLLGFFAAIALILAIIGVYGVMSYTTSQRTHEVGIRMALGATPGRVLWLIVGRGLSLALCGVAIGSALALVLGRVISSVLYGMQSIAPVTIVVVSICLVLAAGIACLVPARRAMSVDPIVALRHE